MDPDSSDDDQGPSRRRRVGVRALTTGFIAWTCALGLLAVFPILWLGADPTIAHARWIGLGLSCLLALGPLTGLGGGVVALTRGPDDGAVRVAAFALTGMSIVGLLGVLLLASTVWGFRGWSFIF